MKKSRLSAALVAALSGDAAVHIFGQQNQPMPIRFPGTATGDTKPLTIGIFPLAVGTQEKGPAPGCEAGSTAHRLTGDLFPFRTKSLTFVGWVQQ